MNFEDPSVGPSEWTLPHQTHRRDNPAKNYLGCQYITLQVETPLTDIIDMCDATRPWFNLPARINKGNSVNNLGYHTSKRSVRTRQKFPHERITVIGGDAVMVKLKPCANIVDGNVRVMLSCCTRIQHVK